MKKKKYPILTQIFKGICITYPTSVISESRFSLMAKIKTSLRNRLSDFTLQNIMRIRCSSTEIINLAIKAVLISKKLPIPII